MTHTHTHTHRHTHTHTDTHTVINNPLDNAGDVGSIPGSGRSPAGENGTHSGILAWKIPWTGEPGGL